MRRHYLPTYLIPVSRLKMVKTHRLYILFSVPDWLHGHEHADFDMCLFHDFMSIRIIGGTNMSRDMWFPTMWHFDKYRLRLACTASYKLRNSKWCSVSNLILIEYPSDKLRLWSDCAYAQADLSLCWSHIPYCWKSHVAAHVFSRHVFHPRNIAFFGMHASTCTCLMFRISHNELCQN